MSTIREYCQRSQGSSCKPLAEAPSSRAAFLGALPCLNPFSAATLAGLPCSLQQLLRKPLDELKQLVPEVPERALSLFLCQATWGEPVRGLHAAGGFRYSPSSGQMYAYHGMLNYMLHRPLSCRWLLTLHSNDSAILTISRSRLHTISVSDMPSFYFALLSFSFGSCVKAVFLVQDVCHLIYPILCYEPMGCTA